MSHFLFKNFCYKASTTPQKSSRDPTEGLGTTILHQAGSENTPLVQYWYLAPRIQGSMTGGLVLGGGDYGAISVWFSMTATDNLFDLAIQFFVHKDLVPMGVRRLYNCRSSPEKQLDVLSNYR